MEDATFRLNMVYTLAAGTAQRPFAAAPVAVCNRRMHEGICFAKLSVNFNSFGRVNLLVSRNLS